MMNSRLRLSPEPRSIKLGEERVDPDGPRLIQLVSANPEELIPAAKKCGFDWETTTRPDAQDVGVVIRVDEGSDIHSQGYELSIDPSVIEIVASTPQGAFYGACTLAQIVRQSKDDLPAISVSDWPDYAVRGVMVDISRDKVPTMETLYHLVDMLAEWKINQIQLYTEHTFAYSKHPVVWQNASPMTADEIRELDAYCKTKFIELVPNQNSFGHMERWLIHPEYNSMAECPEGSQTIWGAKGPISLCPIDERCIPFVAGLYDELLPNFGSNLFNVGCDETIDLGNCKSKSVCEEYGNGRVYLDFLLQIYELVKQREHTMMFWGDIIMNHPELIHELPKDIIALEWGYEADHPFAEHTARFKVARVPFYVCPGTSSWNSIAGRTENCLSNIENAAKCGLEQGAIGFLNTDWGDWGHWQPLSVSYLGFLAGAMYSWNAESDVRGTIADCLSIHAFKDASGITGKVFYELGDVYRCFSKLTHNSSVPFQMLFWRDRESTFEDVSISEVEAMRARVNEIAEEAKSANPCSADAEAVRAEMYHLIHLMWLSADIGQYRLLSQPAPDEDNKIDMIKAEHERVWRMRNRAGGLMDSTGKLKK